MIRLSLAALLAVCVPLTSTAQDEKPRVTALEGTWREAPPPGEKGADKFTITFAGDKVSIRFNGQVFRGTFEGGLGEAPATIVITIDEARDTSGERLIDLERTCSCRCGVRGDQLALRVSIDARRGTSSQRLLDIVPVERSLEKVKK